MEKIERTKMVAFAMGFHDGWTGNNKLNVFRLSYKTAEDAILYDEGYEEAVEMKKTSSFVYKKGIFSNN
jgi:hypothetical protein